MSPSSTHNIQIHSNTVTKTYRPRSHNSAEREWQALTLLAEFAPGLAPSPIKRELSAEPARVTMSKLAGAPLTKPVTSTQVEAMVEAIKVMQQAIPRKILAALPPRAGTPAEMLTGLRPAFAQLPALRVARSVEEAFSEASTWIQHPALDAFAAEEHEPVLGTGDGNLANYLWNGKAIGIVDFEYSGRSDQPYELAEIVEHVSLAASGTINAAQILNRFDLSPTQTARLRESRRLLAAYWLLALLPRDSGRTRNPPGTLERQAARVLDLLN